MRKKILITVLILFMMLFKVSIYAEETINEDAETINDEIISDEIIDDTTDDISDMKNIINLETEYSEVYVGEKIKVTADVTCVDEGEVVSPVWTINNKEVLESTCEAITLEENVKLDLNYTVSSKDLPEMTVSLSLYDQDGQLLSSEEKILKVKKEIPISIKSTTKTKKVYFDKKASVSVQLKNKTDRIYDYKAYWELNGKKIKNYDYGHFEVGKSATSSCSVSLSDFVGKKVKVSFILDNGINKISTDIEIEVINYPPEVIYQKKVAEMKNTIKTVEIECTLLKDSNVYNESTLKKKISYKAKGTKGIYINYRSTTSAKIRFSDGTIGWVSYKNVSISNKNYTDSKGCSDELKEIFINENGYKSETKYLIWISLKFQQVNVFSNEKGKWKLVRSASCSTGKNTTPTISGVFKYSQYQTKWNFGKYYVRPIMRFNGGAALHSRTYRPNGSLLDPTLGKPASHGCVRLKQEDIDWMAKNIPLKTTVVVY